MKYLLVFLFTAISYSSAFAAYPLPGDSATNKSFNSVVGLKITKDVAAAYTQTRKVKQTFFQKIQTKVFQNKWMRTFVSERDEPTEKQKKLGKLSMIIGLSSIVLLFIPYIGILSIPGAITALVLGLKSIKGNSNTQGLIGVIAGSAVLFIIAIAIIVVLSGGYWY